MSKTARRYELDSGCFWIRGGNQLSAKDPRTADEIASVGYFTGMGNIVIFVGPWAEANERYDAEVVEIEARIAASEVS